MDLLGRNRAFCVIFFADTVVRGASFVRAEKQWKLVRWGEEEVSGKNPSTAWKHLLKSLNHRDGLMLVSGAVPGNLFFHFDSADLSVKEQRGAVELELSRRVLALPEDRLVQFASGTVDTAGQCSIGVSLFPAKSLDYLIARLSQSNCRADNYIHPLLALENGDPDVYIPELEAEYAFVNGSWRKLENQQEMSSAVKENWQREISAVCALPDAESGFDFFRMLPVLLVARMVIRGRYDRCRGGLGVLPDKLRPVRYRAHVTISVLLLIIIGGLWLFGALGNVFREYRDYNAIKNSNIALKRKISAHKRTAKKTAKELKEMQKVLSTGAGEPDLVPKLAVLSNALPGNVLVGNVRWSENSVDMTLLSEDDRLNLPAIINPLGLWKIGQLNQRQSGDSAVATISLKLVPIKNAVTSVSGKRGGK